MTLVSTAAKSAALISGVTVSGTAASGEVPVASSASAGAWAYPPGFEIGYDQITATVNITGTTEAAPTTVITCAAHTFDGSACYAEFYSIGLVPPTAAAGNTIKVVLYEGASVIDYFATVQNNATANLQVPVLARFKFTPTAAAHSYLVRAFVTNATGTPLVAAGVGGSAANPPAFVRFVKA